MEITVSHREMSRILTEYAKNLCLYAMNYLPSEADAEDIVQDVFTRFFEKKDNRFFNEKALKTYLFNSVRNACLDKLEKKEIIQYNIDILKQEIIDEETPLFDEKIFQEIQEELSRMPEQTKRIISCVFSKGMKYQEVADELHISVNTVKTLLRKGIQHLRTRFANYPELLVIYFKTQKESNIIIVS